MKMVPVNPPRTFTVGTNIELRDCGRVVLEPDEQVTFITESGAEYDVVRKSWGFYATPSLNDRLPRLGLRPAVVRSTGAKFFVLLVERGQEHAFHEYLRSQGLWLVAWLDDDSVLTAMERTQNG